MTTKEYRTPKSLFDCHRARAKSHESAGQLGLAIRELREAFRLRPRERTTVTELDRLLKVMDPPKVSPEKLPAERLCSIFNLSVRYWDRNMPSAALKEVCAACS
jgi:hypothetical protein